MNEDEALNDEYKYFRNNRDVYIPGEYIERDHTGRSAAQISMYRNNMTFLNRIKPADLRPKKIMTESELRRWLPDSDRDAEEHARYVGNKQLLSALKAQYSAQKSTTERYDKREENSNLARNDSGFTEQEDFRRKSETVERSKPANTGTSPDYRPPSYNLSAFDTIFEKFKKKDVEVNDNASESSHSGHSERSKLGSAHSDRDDEEAPQVGGREESRNAIKRTDSGFSDDLHRKTEQTYQNTF